MNLIKALSNRFSEFPAHIASAVVSVIKMPRTIPAKRQKGLGLLWAQVGGDGFGAAAEPWPLTTRSPIFYQHERRRVRVINLATTSTLIHSLMRIWFLNTLNCGYCLICTRILTSLTSVSSTLRPFNSIWESGSRLKPTTVSQRQTNSNVNGCRVAFATFQVK